MKKIWLAIALVAAIIAGVGAASAVGEGDTVKACHNQGGTLKLQVGDKCPKGWTPVEWSVSGPAGEPGAAGATGATGRGCSGAGWTCGPARRRRISSLRGERHRAFRSGPRRRVRPLRRHLRRLARHSTTPARWKWSRCAPRSPRPSSDPCSPSALQIDHVVLGTQLGSASVPLTERAATGAVIPEVLISLTQARDTRFALLQYTLQGSRGGRHPDGLGRRRPCGGGLAVVRPDRVGVHPAEGRRHCRAPRSGSASTSQPKQPADRRLP